MKSSRDTFIATWIGIITFFQLWNVSHLDIAGQMSKPKEDMCGAIHDNLSPYKFCVFPACMLSWTSAQRWQYIACQRMITSICHSTTHLPPKWGSVYIYLYWWLQCSMLQFHLLAKTTIEPSVLVPDHTVTSQVGEHLLHQNDWFVHCDNCHWSSLLSHPSWLVTLLKIPELTWALSPADVETLKDQVCQIDLRLSLTFLLFILSPSNLSS